MNGKKKLNKVAVIRFAVLGVLLVGGLLTVNGLLKAKDKKLAESAETVEEVVEEKDGSADEKDRDASVKFKLPESKEEEPKESATETQKDDENAGFNYDEFYEQGVDYDEIDDTLSNLTQSPAEPFETFTINDKSYRIGDSTEKFINDGYTIGTVLSGVNAHTMLPVPFSLDGEVKFLGFVYNPSNKNCDVKDTILVKINFYQCSNVTIGDSLTFDNESAEKILGKKTGTFYQSKKVSVWATGKEVGDSYVLIYYGADPDSLFSSISCNLEIRIGVWCFEGEYEQCVNEA